MVNVQKISPGLWFDSEAEEAAKFYTSIFPNSRIVTIARYGKAGFEYHGKPEGSVMTVSFELAGQQFTGINGGPMFKFSPAISFQINCDMQDEIDFYWEKLGAGGDPNAQQCGWLQDKFGLSWQVVPNRLPEWVNGPDAAGAQRAMQSLLKMKKLSIAEIQRAYEG